MKQNLCESSKLKQRVSDNIDELWNELENFGPQGAAGGNLEDFEDEVENTYFLSFEKWRISTENIHKSRKKRKRMAMEDPEMQGLEETRLLNLQVPEETLQEQNLWANSCKIPEKCSCFK